MAYVQTMMFALLIGLYGSSTVLCSMDAQESSDMNSVTASIYPHPQELHLYENGTKEKHFEISPVTLKGEDAHLWNMFEKDKEWFKECAALINNQVENIPKYQCASLTSADFWFSKDENNASFHIVQANKNHGCMTYLTNEHYSLIKRIVQMSQGNCLTATKNKYDEIITKIRVPSVVLSILLSVDDDTHKYIITMTMLGIFGIGYWWGKRR